MIVALDTNILVSATFWTGASFRIMELIDQKELKCVLSDEIIREYEKVLKSDSIIEKAEGKQLMIHDIIEKVVSISTIVYPKNRLKIVKEDPSDNKIIECALEGKADYIITQDNHLLKLKEYKHIKIIRPEGFLQEFKP